MDGISAAASIIAIIDLVAKTGSCIAHYYLAVKHANRDISRLQAELQSLEEVLKDARQICNGPKGGNLPVLERSLNTIKNCYDQLLDLHKILTPAKRSKFAASIRLKELKWPFDKKEVDSLIADFERYKSTISLAFQIDQVKLIQDVKTEIDLAKLPSADSALFDSYSNQVDPICHEKTRIQLRQEIRDWVLNPDARCIFWLNGSAGTGKSTISRTMAKELSSQGRLAANFFFKRGEGDRGNASRFITTLVRQMIQHSPRIKPFIAQAIVVEPAIASKSLNEQFNKLILRPLSTLEDDTHVLPLIFIIDALDECDNENHVKMIIDLFSQARTPKHQKLKIFLTSRPELPIRLGFKSISEDSFQELILHDVSKDTIRQDIKEYMKDSLADVSKNNQHLGSDWPGDSGLQSLVDLAEPLFISAATICRFIGDSRWDPEEQLRIILQYKHAHMDQLALTYQPVLDQLLTGLSSFQKDVLIKEFRAIVGTIVVLEDSLSASALSDLLTIPRKVVEARLNTLHSVLNIPTDVDAPIRLFHLSFRDYLTKVIDQDNPFAIDEDEIHETIAQCCLSLLVKAKCLKADICSLQKPGISRKDVDDQVICRYLPSEVRYACVYFVNHVGKTKCFTNRNDEFDVLLKERFLFWIEALSWLNQAYAIATILDKLLLAIQRTGNENNSSIFLLDARNILQSAQVLLDTAPLQLYSSVLSFAPESSLLRQIYQKSIPTWLETLPKLQGCWSNRNHTNQGHTARINSLSLSKNGLWLASGSSDHTIKLWDAHKGTLQHTLSDHIDEINMVIFSPDSKWLASCSDDGTVKVWVINNGVLYATFDRHTSYVSVIEFSADSRYLAAGGGRNAIIWDMESLTLRYCFEEKSSIKAMTFSPNGQYLAIGAWYVYICRIKSKTIEHRLECGREWGEVERIEYSANNELLAVLSEQRKIFVYDAPTGILRYAVDDCWGYASFSPNGLTLACGALNGMVQIRDASTGEIQHTYNNGKCASVLGFSSEESLLTSSDDYTFKVWNTKIGVCNHVLSGPSEANVFGIFSPDGQYVYCCSTDWSIRSWNVASCTLRYSLEYSSYKVVSVAFSPDSKLLISQEEFQNRWRLWDMKSGAILYEFDCEEACFSPDSRYLLYKIRYRVEDQRFSQIHVWDVATTLLRMCIKVPGYAGARTIVFSPDCKQVLVKFEGKLDVIDVDFGCIQFSLESPREYLFSPNGTQIATYSRTGLILIWSSKSGDLLHTLDPEETRSKSCANKLPVVYSSDSKYLASFLPRSTSIKIWDSSSGNLDCVLQVSKAIGWCDLSYSPDSKQLLAYGYLSSKFGLVDLGSGDWRTFDTPPHYRKSNFSPDSKLIVKYDSELKGNISICDTSSGDTIDSFDVDSRNHRVLFQEDSKCLETDRGLLRLRSGGSISNVMKSDDVFVSDHWISVNRERMLWIPPSFRPTAVDYRNGKHVLGFASGQLMIFDSTADPAHKTQILID